MGERHPDYASLGRADDYRLRLGPGSGLKDAAETSVRLLGSR
ncbi:hypothetical protein [Streptomyces sp. PU-14G]